MSNIEEKKILVEGWEVEPGNTFQYYALQYATYHEDIFSVQNSVARGKGLAQSSVWTCCPKRCQWSEIIFALEERSQRRKTIAIDSPVLLYGRLVIGHR